VSFLAFHCSDLSPFSIRTIFQTTFSGAAGSLSFLGNLTSCPPNFPAPPAPPPPPHPPPPPPGGGVVCFFFFFFFIFFCCFFFFFLGVGFVFFLGKPLLVETLVRVPLFCPARLLNPSPPLPFSPLQGSPGPGSDRSSFVCWPPPLHFVTPDAF